MTNAALRNNDWWHTCKIHLWITETRVWPFFILTVPLSMIWTAWWRHTWKYIKIVSRQRNRIHRRKQCSLKYSSMMALLVNQQFVILQLSFCYLCFLCTVIQDYQDFSYCSTHTVYIKVYPQSELIWTLWKWSSPVQFHECVLKLLKLFFRIKYISDKGKTFCLFVQFPGITCN